jgi:hypothetical protein
VDDCNAEESSAFLICCALNIMGQEHFRYQVDQEVKGLEGTNHDVPIVIEMHFTCNVIGTSF